MSAPWSAATSHNRRSRTSGRMLEETVRVAVRLMCLILPVLVPLLEWFTVACFFVCVYVSARSCLSVLVGESIEPQRSRGKKLYK